MRQRTVVGSIGAAAALALLVFWLGNAPSRVSAMERMAENIRRARSYKVTWIFERQFVRELGKPPVTAHAKSTVFWLAPGSFRLENTGDETWVGQEDTQIYPVGKPGIDIDVKKKTFQSVAGRRGRMSSIILLDELGKFSGQADQALGTKEIDGKQARGFEIDAKKIDPDGFSGPMQIWIDAESQLPVFLHYEFDEAGTPATLTMRDFQWNLDLDPKLFEARAPDGYVNLTKPSKSAEVQVRIITDGMRDYAELSGGHYPLVKMVYGDVTLGELYKMIGVKNQRPTPEQVGSNEYVKAMRASAAATHLNGILRDNPDAAYYGKTVEPKDADKILVRWKLENGQYQVIYGDLRSESVTAERLRELEGK